MSYLCSDMHCSTLNMGIFMTHSDVILVGLLLTTASIHSCAKSNFAGSNGSPPPTKKSANSNTTTSTSTGGDPSAVSVEGGGTTGPSNCISGDFENKKYLICKGQKTKAESAVFCGEQKMDLAHIDSEAENKYLVSTALAANGCTTWQDTSYWVSNTTSTTIQAWPSSGKVWAPGEPLNDGDDIHMLRYCTSPYGWNDLNAATGIKFGWVCKSK